ncbi:WD40-repeat-containing domain protein, partial [Lipomyces oligophaga]|uniref:WD40-repeat-containing domain protein n=1 Tax=Lipomyces oligophaga TaxID=45792 RepID=UPI0034CFD5BB
HTAILEYLAFSGLQISHDALKTELKLDSNTLEQDRERYDGLLEKKWTSVVRLQKKIMDLETKVSLLQTELDNQPASSVRIADPTTWLPRLPKYQLLSHRQAVTSIAFHPVFTVLASGSEDTTIKIWDWDTGELEQTLRGHTKTVTDLDFGGRLASASSDLTIKIWSAADMYQNIKSLKGHDHTVSAVKFLPDGERLASASRDKTIRIWNIDSGYCVRTIFGHTDWIRALEPSLGGEFIISTGSDQSVRVTDAHTGDCKLVLAAHEHAVECVAVAPASSYGYISAISDLGQVPSSSSEYGYFATGARDRTIKLWDYRGNLVHTFEGHDNWVRALVFHPGGKFLLSAGDDKTIKCWDLTQAGKCVRSIENAHDHFICALKWAPSVSTRSKQSATNGATRNGKSPPSPQTTQAIRCVVASASSYLDIKVWIG